MEAAIKEAFRREPQMSRSSSRRIALLLLLATFFTGSWAAAAPLRSSPNRGAQIGLLWNLLAMTLQKAGCSLDPSGATCSRSAMPRDNGCSLDPNGRCAPAAIHQDEGCSLDPSGRCRG